MALTEKTDNILNAVTDGKRLSVEDALFLFDIGDFFKLGKAADKVRRHHHPDDRVTFIIDRNINYTNVCINRCGFCAFYRENKSPDAYILTIPEVIKKVGEAVDMGGTQIMLQGGLHPDLDITYYEMIFKAIKDKFDVVLHSLSPPEIIHIAKNSSLSIEDTLIRLKAAGLASLPGGGAEILSDKTRKRVSPKKISASEWLSVMKAAHGAGLYTTATMMFGIGEDLDERVEHMEKIRELQDETGMFRAFIPWTFMPGNTYIGGKEASPEDYLRTVAMSRLFLDNITNIQGSWLTQGMDIGQLSLFFGTNDLGSTMLEENVVRSTGVNHKMDVEKIVKIIKMSGFIPAQRDTQYNIIKEFD